jgi:hypothetical protein
MRSRFLLVLAMLTPLTASAAQVSRAHYNYWAENMVFLEPAQAYGQQGPNRQTFINNLDYLNHIQLVVGGNMSAYSSNEIVVKLYDGCGNLVSQARQSFNNSGLTTSTSWKWVDVVFGSVPMNYGAYYFLEVSLTYLNTGTIVLNTDRFNWGRFIDWNFHAGFPNKKRDLMMYIYGTADSSKSAFPSFNTNVACPSRCLLANPSGAEVTAYGADKQFNVIVQGKTTSGMGSFWAENNPSSLATLRAEIATMLQGTADLPGLRETYPYNSYRAFGNSGNQFYYGNMNFYIAIEDPAKDTADYRNYGLPFRGFHYCANIDAVINVQDGVSGGTGVMGRMEGNIGRPNGPNSTGWGAGGVGRFALLHEVFGHGAGLNDEYTYSGTSNSSQVWAVGLQSSQGGYAPNSLPLASGCSTFCGGAQPVSWLVGQTSSNGCWSQTTQTGCNSAPGGNVCRWIGGLAAIPYWGSYQCIPLAATTVNIGVNCSSYGNDSCYPIAPLYSSVGGVMDVVQPNSSIMQGFHHISSAVPYNGFGNHVESYMKDLLDCVFPYFPCFEGNSLRCQSLKTKYGTSGSGYQQFLEFANACDVNGANVRRR